MTEEKGSNANNADEWGEFLHLPGQKFFDFGKIREEIVRDTEKMTGKNAGEPCLFHFPVPCVVALLTSPFIRRYLS